MIAIALILFSSVAARSEQNAIQNFGASVQGISRPLYVTDREGVSIYDIITAISYCVSSATIPLYQKLLDRRRPSLNGG